MIPRILAFLLAAFVAFWTINQMYKEGAVNPDPNHTHADFAVWIGGKQIDFSVAKYMSGSSAEEVGDDHGHEHKHDYLHLHDGNGRVIHRHKPGLSVGEFFASIGFGFGSQKQGEWCWYAMQAGKPFAKCESGPLKLYANDALVSGNPADYVFADTDHLLITDALLESDINYQLGLLSSDACLYSQTCPERGKPPVENCIADPEIPCKI